MIELPQWFLIVIGVVTFAAAHRRRRGLTLMHGGGQEPF